MRGSLKPALLVLLLAITSTTACVMIYRDASQHTTLRARAERVFAYDQAHHRALPAHRLRALSVALEFHDDRGAEMLISQLESGLAGRAAVQ